MMTESTYRDYVMSQVMLITERLAQLERRMAELELEGKVAKREHAEFRLIVTGQIRRVADAVRAIAELPN